MENVSTFWAVPGKSENVSPPGWNSNRINSIPGADMSAMSALNDENPDNLNTSSQISALAKPTGQESTKITPKVVATPLPPLNLSQIGNMCPRTTANAAIAEQSGPYSEPAKVAIKPLPRSSPKVAAAKPLFPARSTLVAPILPDPTVLGSVFPANFDRSNPKGMEPRQ